MKFDDALSPGQAAYVIRQLLAEQRISRSDISRYLAELTEEILALEARLEELHAAAPEGSLKTGPKEQPATVEVPKTRRRRSKKPRTAPHEASSPSEPSPPKRERRPISAKTRAKYKLMGSYMGYLRQVTGKKHFEFQKIKEEQGFEPAIAALRKHLRK